MICSSSLTDDGTPLVLDTSVLINLHASTFGERILNVIPNDLAIPREVIRELEHETSKVNGEHNFLQQLIAQGRVQPLQMNDQAFCIFEQLIQDRPSLGDGEAATIALSAVDNLLPVMDDGKGRSRAKPLVSPKTPAWSLDLFLHPRVKASLSNEEFSEAIFLALSIGRMRIDEAQCDHIVNLLGYRRALQCYSLPGYKLRQQQWTAS